MNKHIIPLLALERDETVSLLDVEPFLRAAEWKVMVSANVQRAPRFERLSIIEKGCGAYAVALLGLALLHDDGRHRRARDDAQLRRRRYEERVARCSEETEEEAAH